MVSEIDFDVLFNELKRFLRNKDCSLKDNDRMLNILETLLTNDELETLDLSHKKAKNTGTDIISKALKKNTSLTSLNLYNNAIGVEGTEFSRILRGLSFFNRNIFEYS